MAQENIIKKLPISGIEAEIRGYVRRKDERRVESAFFGKEATVNTEGEDKSMKLNVDFAGEKDVKVWTMLVRLGDNTDVSQDDVGELHKEDFDAILAVVEPMLPSSFDAEASKGKKSTTGAKK